MQNSPDVAVKHTSHSRRSVSPRARHLRLLIGMSLLAVLAWPGEKPQAQGPNPCLPPQGNAITCENTLPGNPESDWQVDGAGDESIQGFATAISVVPGEIQRFKVRTDASAYRIDLFRLGYYGGLGARKVATVLPSVGLPQNQPNCLNDFSTGLVDCGNWAVSASWTVPASAVSGVYIARLVRTDTGGASHMVFIVRDDTRQSELLFQTSDSTWHAYNSYGGNSLYEGMPVGRAYKVSYNRPFNNRAFSGGPRESFLFNAEYPMLRWLEANGYDVSYTTNVDTDRRPAEIREHRAFLSVGHDEYWSAGQRANVEAARNAGVHLAFFSGNEVFWKTRWEPSIDGSGTQYRTLVSYKETHANAKIDPLSNIWTGTWRDPRFSPPADGGRPENALTGTLFMVNGTRNDAITVPAAEGRLRFWRNTSIASMPAGTLATLPTGTLGYEWDVDADNGSRPAGLMRLSSTSVDVTPLFLQDYGSTYGAGVANHALTLYKHASGALVFGAGTVQWSWGLDDNHDREGGAPDVRMQQATVNLLADMGAQPDTLQAGLLASSASADSAPPASVITSPAAGATVQVGTGLMIAGTADDGTGGVVGAVEVSVDNGATWRPASGREQWTYTITPQQVGTMTIRSRAVDDSGNIETPTAGRTITVQSGNVAPVISSVEVSPTTTSATISWNTNEPADSQIDYGPTASYGASTPLDPSLVTSHVQTITGLSPSTTYHFRVRSRDGGGLLSVSNDVVFTTPATDPTQIVTFDDLSGQSQPLNGPYPAGVLNWGTGQWYHSGPFGSFTTKSISLQSHLTTGTVQFLQARRLTRIDAFNGGAAAATIRLTCTGQTDVQVVLGAGELRTITTGWTQSCSPVTLSASNGWDTNFDNLALDPATDTTAPVISAVQIAQLQSTSAVATWTTNEPATTQVEYGPTAAYGSVSPLDTALTTGHSAPLTGLAANTVYHYRVRSRDGSGNLAVSADSTFTTPAVGACPCSLWPTTATPAIASQADTSPVEVGVRFRADSNGLIRGLRFYKGPANQGQHVARLWTATGTPLASATFVNETASGWQEVLFPSPVAITANTTYVASYYAPQGGYSVTRDAFTTQYDRAPLHAPASTPEAGNGLFVYGVGGGFPTSAFQASNYWVDVVYSPTTDTTPPTISDAQVTVGTTSATFTWNTNEPADAQVEYGLTTSYGTLSTLDTTQATQHSITLTGLTPGTLYHARIRSRDAAGNLGLSADGTFTTTAADTTPPVISAVQATQVTASSATISWTTDEAADTQVEYGVTSAYGTSTPLVSALVTSHTVGLTGLAANTTYFYRVRSRDAAGNLATSTGGSFATTASGGCPCTLWPAAVTPATASQSDTNPVEIGVRFRSDVAGSITRLRFYKGPGNTGQHVAHLWTNTGGLLATATFTGESATGWQEVAFASPAAITANTTYVASYYAPNGGYAVNPQYFVNQYDNGPLHAPANVEGANNGVFVYGSGGGFPTSAYQASNYWVDVVFVPGSDTTAPAITNVQATPGPGAATITWTTNEASDSQVEFGTTTAYGSLSALDTVLVTGHTVQLGGLAANTLYHYRVRSRDGAGNLALSTDRTFTTPAASACPCTIWPSSATPAVPSQDDTLPVEIGVKFRAAQNGLIRGIRFYKGAANTGQHVAHLWSSTGALLATATFTNETASGWQQVIFASPVAIAANTTYVASYYAPNGGYAVTADYFTTPRDNPPLHAPASSTSGGNGVYHYGVGGGFPTQTYRAGNYWVDVIFTP